MWKEDRKWEKVFVNQICNKALEYRICNELLQFKIERQTIQLTNGQRIWMEIFLYIQMTTKQTKRCSKSFGLTETQNHNELSPLAYTMANI